ncbi:hypothetical protein BT93_A0897 [Corymbia citriodora subsp. variegata]|uniref:Mitochondrial import inner membrane translocase subunit n=1 Tax=Corymbia citriodora subsp. variegata TaxID=360336 RepID=A0A8T0CLS6_CORYI|nr:hypothetical protein BT93_L3507 [Corymbia citriodora subsp. variegata]KAF8042405.1 hypothetical protein BT93_A0897 [Corymbia citriodora subsp. variegata]
MALFLQRKRGSTCLRLYNSLVERCFIDCINSFYRKSLGKQEERCVFHCAEKFLKVSAHVGMRLAELNQAEQQSIQR